jgi:hypothetical protein
LRDAVTGVLQNAVISETINFARIGGSPPGHDGFARTMFAVVVVDLLMQS